MRILTLIENTSATERLVIEHGVSFYIEAGGKKILFDTGSSEKWAENARRMRVDIKNIDCAVLSYNHADHVGGIDALLSTCPYIKIYMRKDAQSNNYKRMGIFKISIGHSTEFYARRKDNIVAFNSFQEICPGVFLMSDECGEKRHICNDRSLMVEKDGKIVKDMFEGELFMTIFPGEEKKGCVIVSSCSYRGIINIIKTVQNSWIGVPIIAVVGGFHLMGSSTKKINCSASYVSELAKELKDLNIGMLYTCHCTGQMGYDMLKAELGDQVQYLQTGEELEF
ncbi:MAG: MBL fold metallo-hydrolase [Eubacterium sp.]|jgi:7,8-dihydropterin-6-yl-methyl-4-(beta-D-ribofuranosyl)aminobenzene 5'-phosphate synthase|nr:MBL fold metallo-hydrolase [Eubacterium sp.]